MVSKILFWLLLALLLLSWELVLARPVELLYWVSLCIGASAGLGWYIVQGEQNWKQILVQRLGFVLVSVGIFWWVLWLDFVVLKFIVPLVGALVFAYVLHDSITQMPHGLSGKAQLILFFGGTFLWASVSFGLLIVLGWELWSTLGVFVVSFGVLAYLGVGYLTTQTSEHVRMWLLVLLLGAQFYSVIAWLPFTEVTLALLLVIPIIAMYDFLKYYLKPDLIYGVIIARKIALYVLFMVLVLASTSWY
jgi:hypothetical protein